MVYILKHPIEGFTGFMLGVGFENGVGSTSDRTDRDLLVAKHGCEDITDGPKAKEPIVVEAQPETKPEAEEKTPKPKRKK